MNMNIFKIRRESLSAMLQQDIAIALALALLFWAMGVPTFVRNAHAAQLSDVSDTISDSAPGVATKHVISFTNTAAINANQTIKVQLDPTGSAFSEAYSTATSSDIYFKAGATTYSIVGTCSTNGQVTLAANYNNGSDENLTFTVCSSDNPIATSTAITITVGSTTPLWTNPSTSGSYVVRIAGTSANAGDTRVAVLPSVKVTAAVDTNFTFTVSGLATSTTYNGITTTGSSTATTLPFGTLTPNASSTLGQALSVATNARNGFAVTVQEDQPLTSANGSEIALFDNGATTSVPTAWADPTNQLSNPATWGHLGISSDDSNEGSGEFSGSKYAGNIDQPRQIFSNSGPADGTTQNEGLAHVFYTIEVGTLQPAANDYTNTLTYVATPTF